MYFETILLHNYALMSSYIVFYISICVLFDLHIMLLQFSCLNNSNFVP